MEEVMAGMECMKAIRYSVAEVEPAMDALEMFRKGLTHALGSRSAANHEAIGQLEPKAQVAEFLSAFQMADGRLRRYRARVNSVATRLLTIESWESAFRSNSTAMACFREFLGEDSDGEELGVPK